MRSSGQRRPAVLGSPPWQPPGRSPTPRSRRAPGAPSGRGARRSRRAAARDRRRPARALPPAIAGQRPGRRRGPRRRAGRQQHQEHEERQHQPHQRPSARLPTPLTDERATRLAADLAARRLSADAARVRRGGGAPGRAGRLARRAHGSGHPRITREDPARSPIRRRCDFLRALEDERRPAGHARPHPPDDRARLDAGRVLSRARLRPRAGRAAQLPTRAETSRRPRRGDGHPSPRRARAGDPRLRAAGLAALAGRRGRWSPSGASISTRSSAGIVRRRRRARAAGHRVGLAGRRSRPPRQRPTRTPEHGSGVDTRLAIHPADMRRPGQRRAIRRVISPSGGQDADSELHQLSSRPAPNDRGAAPVSKKLRAAACSAPVTPYADLGRRERFRRPDRRRWRQRVSAGARRDGGQTAAPMLPPADRDEAAPLPIDLVLWGAGINVAVRSFFRRLFGWRRHAGDVEAICRRWSTSCWTGEFFAGSAGHFKQFWTRDLAMCTPALCRLGERDRVIQSLDWGLARFERAGRITTTIFNRRFPRDVYAFGSDSLPMLLYALRAADAPHLIDRHRALLAREIDRYVAHDVRSLDRPGPRQRLFLGAARLHDRALDGLRQHHDRAAHQAARRRRAAPQPAGGPRPRRADRAATTGRGATSAIRSIAISPRATPTSGRSSSRW